MTARKARPKTGRPPGPFPECGNTAPKELCRWRSSLRMCAREIDDGCVESAMCGLDYCDTHHAAWIAAVEHREASTARQVAP